MHIFFAKLKNGLSKTRESINSKLDQVIKVFKTVDEDLLEELVGDIQDESDASEGLQLI